MNRKILIFSFFCIFSFAVFSQKNTSSSRIPNVINEPKKLEEIISDTLKLSSSSKKSVELKTTKIAKEIIADSTSTLMNTTRKQETKIENK